ncbi:SDR family oxidoreductase [Thalassotalea sp. G2M2-11]|uniref:SDR family NAD(P)-dependent oxidoreductase n=1 Tax=Thalassotalea sp. G2M2-11 TaxID=2787627 RepID=UPI0019D18FB0|nr:SDR family oxidoreductase [Thalassotalea sp. G2M2-11]
MIVLVTGAYGGIGTAVCHQYLQQGVTLVISGRNSQKLNALHETLAKQYKNPIVSLISDNNEPEQITALFKDIHQTFKRLDVFVHCAGSLYEAPVMMSKYQDIVETIQSNLTSSILLAQQASKLMMRTKFGVITFFSSVVAQQGAQGQSVYAAAKSGLEGLTKSLARELGGMGIRVNAIAPGVIDTPMVAHFSVEQKKQLAEKTVLGRLGSAEEIANVACFLSSPQASYITGQIIAVDGGLVV